MFDFERLSSFDAGLNEIERAQDAVKRVLERTSALRKTTQQAIDSSSARITRVAPE